MPIGRAPPSSFIRRPSSRGDHAFLERAGCRQTADRCLRYVELRATSACASPLASLCAGAMFLRSTMALVGGICRLILSKKCALTSPASGAGLDAGGPHPSPFIQRSRLTCRCAEPCRLRFSKPSVCLRSAGRCQPRAPSTLSRRRIRTGFQVMAAPCAKARVGRLSDGT
jgi:hypothetical protein